MNDFHYDYIKKKYGSKAKFLMTDTGSFMYEIKTDDFFKDISDVREKFDVSNFSLRHLRCSREIRYIKLPTKPSIRNTNRL